MACSINSSTSSDHTHLVQRKSSSNSTVDVESLKPKSEPEPPILRWWNKIVVVSCVIAVLTDPLFFYIPLINDQRKCLAMDKNLRIVALLLRSLTDIIFLIDITHQVRERNKTMALKVSKNPSPSNSSTSSAENGKKDALDVSHVSRRLRRLSVSILIHLVAILPFPQVSLLLFFNRMRNTSYQSRTRILNVFLLFQYGPNIYRLRLSYKKLNITQRLVKGAFNFFSYIIASHVVGAFWYFFSIQRETSCWHQACGNIAGCIPIHCDDNPPTNIGFLNESCPINPSNATVFDFGMYLDTLQSGYTRQRSLPKKFFYSFWWGLKNLSNFGTNLETSSYVWENCFAILISVTGLLLFLYLIGNVQAYMQFSKSKEMNDDDLNKKMKEKENEILRYLTPRDVMPPDTMTEEIMANMKHIKLKNKLDADVDMDFIFYLLPLHIVTNIKHHMGMKALQKVPKLRLMEEEVLQKICEHLKPVSYLNGHVFKAGKAIDEMLFTIEGSIGGEETLDYFGEELLEWVSPSISFSDLKLPTRAQELKCQTKAEAFILIAKDLRSVVKDFRRLWNWNLYECDINPAEFEESAHSLNKRNDQRYIQLWKENLTSVHRKKMKKDITDWVSRIGLDEDVDKQIREHIEERNIVNKNIDSSVDLQFLFSVLPQTIKNAIGMYVLRKVPMLEKMPDYMLESICRYLEPVIYDENIHVIGAGTPLDSMLFVIEGIMICTKTTNFDAALTRNYVIPKLYLEKGDVYGEILMSWTSSEPNPFRHPPMFTQDFKCHKKIEAFSLKASQLQNVVSKHGNLWMDYYIPPPDYENKTYIQQLKEVQRQLKSTTTWEKIEDEKFRHEMKILNKEIDILDWLLRHAIPDDVTTDIMENIKENEVVKKKSMSHMDVEYLLSIDLPWSIEKSVRQHLSMTALKEVLMLQQMPDIILESICNHLTPVVYPNNCYVAEKGKALDLMLIIIEGEIALTDTKTTDTAMLDSSATTIVLGKGDIFGTELLNWASPKMLFAGSAPISAKYAQCQKNVEAFTLTTTKLRSIVSDQWTSTQETDQISIQNIGTEEQFLIEYDDKWKTMEPIDSEELQQQMTIKNKENKVLEWMSKHELDEELKRKVMLYIRMNNSVGKNMNSDVDVKYLLSLIPWVLAKPIAQQLCMTALKNVPKLQTMPEYVLEKMCSHLQPVVYDQYSRQSLDFMLIIVEGEIEWVSDDVMFSRINRGKGDIYGEQLLDWASSSVRFSGAVPTSVVEVECRYKVEAFCLSTKHLMSVVSEYESEWESNFQNRANECTPGGSRFPEPGGTAESVLPPGYGVTYTVPTSSWDYFFQTIFE